MKNMFMLLALLAGSPLAAQTISRPMLSLDGAKQIVGAAEKEARRRGLQVTIAVLDPSGQPVAIQRMDGAPQATFAVALGKARTAATWGMPSAQFEKWLGDGGLRLLSLPETVVIEGGVPISWSGATIGAVGVSGGSSQDDAAVAQAGIAALRAAPGAAQ